MSVQIDPEEHELEALFACVDTFAGKRVLEVGCGDGRLTWHYADQATYVLGIDPDYESIAKAVKDTPKALRNHVEFVARSVDQCKTKVKFDLALLSWSL